MATNQVKLPPIPDGFQLENGGNALPAIPDGFQLENAPAQADAPVTAAGSAAALASGAAKGFADIPGGLINLGNLVRKVDPLNLPGMEHQQVPVPDALQKVSAAADSLYTPKNSVESGLKTAGEYVPAVVSGPEGIMGKGTLDAAKILAKRVAYQAAAPQMAGQVASTMAKGTPAEDIAGPLAALAVGARAGIKKPEAAASAPILDAADAGYDAFRNADVDLHPGVVKGFAKNLQYHLESLDHEDTPTYRLLNKYANANAPVPLSKLQTLNARLVEQAKAGGSDGHAAMVAKDWLGNFIPKLDSMPGAAVRNPQNLSPAVSAWNDANTNWAVGNTVKAVENAQYRAKINNASSYQGDNDINTLRQAMKPLLLNPKLAGRFKAMQPDIENIVEGSAPLNGWRRMGALFNGHNSFLFPLMVSEALRHVDPTGGVLAGLGAYGVTKGLAMATNKVGAVNQTGKVTNLINKIASNAQGVQLPTAHSTLALRIPGIAAALAARSQ